MSWEAVQQAVDIWKSCLTPQGSCWSCPPSAGLASERCQVRVGGTRPGLGDTETGCISVSRRCVSLNMSQPPPRSVDSERWAGNGSMGFHGLLRGFSWTGFGVPTGYTVCISDTLPTPVRPRGMHMKFLLCVCSRDPSDEKLIPLPCALPGPGAAGRSQVKN